MIVMRGYLFCGLLFISYTASKAFDAFGDPKYVQSLFAMQAEHHQTSRLEGSFQGAALDLQLNSDLAQQAAVFNSFLGAAYATGAALTVQWWSQDKVNLQKQKLVRNYNSIKKVMGTLAALGIGAYIGYIIPSETADQSGSALHMFYGVVLADVASVCVGTVAGMVASS